ncbi:MAG TPA: hypothetical protein VF773_11635 [Verrucomicrobiae bacterium]
MTEEEHDNPLLAEVQAEKASAYFARVRSMQAALARLAQFDRVPNSKQPGPQNGRTELFAEAAEQVWFFMIQREAMKLPYYEEVFKDFDIPDEVRRRMGPKEFNCPPSSRT